MNMLTENDGHRREESINEARLEQLLSEKLMQGYVLLEASCPVCSTPLVKNHHMVPKSLSMKSESFEGGTFKKNVLLPQESFDQPFRPVEGVPICVSCKSHVITQETEISILEQCDSLRDKGSIYVALKEVKEGPSAGGSDDENHQPQANNKNFDSPPEVIHLENIEEENFINSRRLHLDVDIHAVECEDNDMNSAFEVISSPRVAVGHDVLKSEPVHIFAEEDEDMEVEQQPQEHPEPIFVEDPAYIAETSSGTKKESLDRADVIEEYSVRREIATKVLGAKMLQGYTLRETTCDKCGMPVMDFKGKVDCVVCPVLAKKAKKKIKANQKLEEEKVRLERKVQEKKELEKERIEKDRIEREQKEAVAFDNEIIRQERAELERIEKERQEQRLEFDRIEREELERIEQLRIEMEEKRIQEEQEEMTRAEEKRGELEEEKSRILALEKVEGQRIQQLEEEEFKLLEEARERAHALVEQERKEELARLEAIAKEEEANHRIMEAQREREVSLAAREAEQKARQEAEEKALLEESKKLEAFDENTVCDKTQVTKMDVMAEEHRKRLAGKAVLDKEIVKLGEERISEEMEFRRLAEYRRAESEDRMIAALEADAAVKALAAEHAICRAKVALLSVTSTKREIISQTIAMAEREAVAETEKVISAECEDYKEQVILPSESELFEERWETLRMESRSIMTRRVLQGWDLLPIGCKGSECHLSPLVCKLGKKECVVCGGTGTGEDGVYIDEDAEKPTVIQPNTLPKTYVYDNIDDDVLTYGKQNKHDDFEQKREIVSKEIGKRMMMGWQLIDASCPRCIMPLMIDDLGNSDICVLCGEMEQQFDASTIATKEMMMTTLEASTYAVEVIETVEEDAANEVTDEVEVINLEEFSEPATGASDRKKSSSSKSPTAETIEETQAPSVRQVDLPHAPSHSLNVDESDLCSYIREQTSRKDDNVPAPRSDPPAYTSFPRSPTYEGLDAPPSFADENQEEEFEEDNYYTEKDTSADEVFTLPKSVDFADALAIQQLVVVDEEEEEHQANDGSSADNPIDISTEMIVNMFLRSPHGYDFYDSGAKLSLEDVKERVDIFVVTNMDSDISDDFKFNVAQKIIEKLENADVIHPLHGDEQRTPAAPTPTPPPQQNNFHFDEEKSVMTNGGSQRRKAPRPEEMARRTLAPRFPPKSPASKSSSRPSKGRGSNSNTVIVGGPLSGGQRYNHRQRGDDCDGSSVGGASRASSVASDVLESIYEKIEACKEKLMDPSNNLDEQIATASLLEKLATAAVAMKEMELLE